MFTKEERLFIWKKVYEEIERCLFLYHRGMARRAGMYVSVLGISQTIKQKSYENIQE